MRVIKEMKHYRAIQSNDGKYRIQQRVRGGYRTTEHEYKTETGAIKKLETMEKRKQRQAKYAHEMRRNSIAHELGKRMLREHLGRWCTITMKKDEKKFEVIRDGYGPMEYPEKDACHIVDVEKGTTIGEAKTLYEMADLIIGMGY